MSLGRDKVAGDMELTGTIRGAIRELYTAGITVVVSAGNEAGKEVLGKIPAGLPEVVAVASTTANAGTNLCNRIANAIGAGTASYFTTDGAYTSTSPYGFIGIDLGAG